MCCAGREESEGCCVMQVDYLKKKKDEKRKGVQGVGWAVRVIWLPAYWTAIGVGQGSNQALLAKRVPWTARKTCDCCVHMAS